MQGLLYHHNVCLLQVEIVFVEQRIHLFVKIEMIARQYTVLFLKVRFKLVRKDFSFDKTLGLILSEVWMQVQQKRWPHFEAVVSVRGP